MKKLSTILEHEPSYRQAQIERAWFDVGINGYEEITTLPVGLREQLKDEPWISVTVHTMLTSRIDNTKKILFKLRDNNYIETVLMGRQNLKRPAKRSDDERPEGGSQDRYTICISSQAGCPMRCAFCATGKAGFKRHLSAEEIIDQYRFCQRLLAEESAAAGLLVARVSNIVMMGQGEPLLNYDNVKRALNVLLRNTDLGETKITLSTAGVVPAMEKMLNDPDFPPVRWAISLHSAIEETRKQIMPSHRKGFLDFLVDWAAGFRNKYPGRSRFIGLEYIMLGKVNDDERHLQALIAFAKKLPSVRINLIPYNYIGDEPASPPNPVLETPRFPTSFRRLGDASVDNVNYFSRTAPEEIERWHEALMAAGFTSTIRYSQGQDIAAACGQLRNKVILKNG